MKQESMSLRTTLENFLNHAETLEAKKAEGEDLYEKEFQLLKTLSESLRCLPQYSCSYGEKDTNRRKNRYKDILPYDYTRVSLSEIPGVPGSDFVNANYIKGASGSLAYIASQGPLPHTVEDFWRMIWECEVQVVVMASSEMEGGKHKCERYWPYEDEERTFGNLTIVLLRLKQVCSDFLVRTIKVSSSDEERTVIQFHYVSWPDHGIPDAVSPILNMTKLVRDCQSSETLPVLVHCSAGCGRTGTICAIDYVWGLLRAGKLTDDFSLFQLISDMRKQRIAMVQTKEQYILVHRAVKELFEQHLKVMDSHHYENVDFSGCPMIKNDVDYEFIDVEDPDIKSLGKASDGNTQNSDTDASEDVRRSAERIGVSDLSRKVPPLPKKRRSALPPTNAKESDSDSCESQVRLLISTWNHGKPLPVEKPDNEANADEEDRLTAGERIAEDPYLDEKALDRRNSPAELIIKNDLLPTDKAVVIRKPSIAKLRAIFEKNSDSGSPTSDTTEVPFARRTKHKKKDKLNLPDNDEPAESNLELKPSKRSRSPFKKSSPDNPEMRSVSTRYKDTALKVYSEFKQRDGSQDKSDGGTTPPESSPGSARTEKSPPPERRPSPTVPEFLRRVGSRRGAAAANRTTSVWYDQASTGEEGKPEEDNRPEEKPALPVKRSKSMKVQSITENAFGLFRLPSPIRQRKVAAYLGVEDRKSSKESSPVPQSSVPGNTSLCEIAEVSPNPDQIPTNHERPTDLPARSENNSRLSPDKATQRHAENLLASPKIFKRFYSRSASQSDKDPSEDTSPQKDKPKLRYFFGDRQPDVVAGSGAHHPVQLVRVRSKSDDAQNCRPTQPDVIPSKNTATENADFIHTHHSISHGNPLSIAESTLNPNPGSSATNAPATITVTSTSPSSPSSVLNPSSPDTDRKLLPKSETKESSDDASSLIPHHYVNVILTKDIPPPLPVKKNSPANSPLMHRQAKVIIPQASYSAPNTQDSLMQVPDAWASSPHSEMPAELLVVEDEQVTDTRQSPVDAVGGTDFNRSTEIIERKEINADTIVPLDAESQKTPLLFVPAVSSEVDKPVSPQSKSSNVEADESYQQIIRDCQEYLLSSGYSNVFPEMSRNLMMIEQSLEKYPRGGFVDILSSIDDLSDTKDGSKSDLRVPEAKMDDCLKNKDTSQVLVNLDKVAENSTTLENDVTAPITCKGNSIQGEILEGNSGLGILEGNYSEQVHDGNIVADIGALSLVSEVTSNIRDYHTSKELTAYNEEQMSKYKQDYANSTSTTSPRASIADSSPKEESVEETHSSIVPADVCLENVSSEKSSEFPVIRAEYEHLWLSQSSDLPTLVKEDTGSCFESSEKAQPPPKVPSLMSRDTPSSPTKALRFESGQEGSYDASGEKDAISSIINKERASSASPQLSRIPVRCKRTNSKHKDKDSDNKTTRVNLCKVEAEEISPSFQKSGCIDEDGDAFGGLSSPKLLKELTHQAFVDKTDQAKVSNEWQLNSSKMVKEAMSNSSPIDGCPLKSAMRNKCNALGDGDGPNAPLNRAIQEMETLAKVMEKDEEEASSVRKKLEPPVKPLRNQGDGKPRKPQPLPRSILLNKRDISVKIPEAVTNQEIQSPAIRSYERKKRKGSFSSISSLPSSVLPIEKAVPPVRPPPCEDREFLKGVVKCAVKSDENAFIYRPRREHVVNLGSSSTVTNGQNIDLVDSAQKPNHEYEELDRRKSPCKQERKKVEHEYEEIYFKESEPSHERLIDIARRASSKENRPARPAHSRQRSVDLNESSPSDEEKLSSADSAVLKGVLLLPIAGKVEIQCTPEKNDIISPSSHVYETVGGDLTRQNKRAESKPTMIPKYAMVSTEALNEEYRPTVRKRSASLKRKSLTRKASLDASFASDKAVSSYVENLQRKSEATYSQLDKEQTAVYDPQDCLYSEVSKERSKLTQPYRRCLVDSPSPQRHSNRKSRYSKDDLELCPVVPPRVKRQSSASLRRNTVLDSNAGSNDAFWWTHTLPGRLNNPSLAMEVSKWGEDWDSDEDCQPPVPAKTREAYMLPQPDSSSSGSSTVTDGGSPSYAQDHSFASKTKAKFNLLSRFGLKGDGKGSDGNATTPVVRPARSTVSQPSTAKPTGHGVPGFGFPHRLPKKPHGPRDPPSNWQFANRST